MKTIDEYITAWATLDATYSSAEHAIASQILRDLKGYRQNAAFRDRDVTELGTMLQAYAKLLQNHGVKVT